jgi:hypothetical protein
MENTINRLYQFLLADPQKDPSYTEGNEVDGYLVYGTAKEMKERFEQAFDKESILSHVPVWHVEDCTVIYETKRDKEIPNKPRCFGYLTVVGRKPNVKKVDDILTENFPGIDKLVKECD